MNTSIELVEPNSEILRVGIDVGSTTVKIVFLDSENNLIFEDYRWHYSDVRKTLAELFEEVTEKFEGKPLSVVMSGSGGLALSQLLGLHFEQEVIAGTKAIEIFIPETDVAIELGGEDAKLTYFDLNGVDQRMNNSCAGGTGAFVDQMATLLDTDSQGLNILARNYKNIYPIAARCGVFAKTDVQPLINEGASKEDIAASILQAIVTQTISGLACGKPIRGRVAFLGGPLTYLSVLRELFIKTLRLVPENVIFPDNSKLFVAMGAALLSHSNILLVDIGELKNRLKNLPSHNISEANLLPALFKTEDELVDFRARHSKQSVTRGDIASYDGPIFLGIDSGSTTTKAAAIGHNGELLYSFYRGNGGNPVVVVQELIKDLYGKMGPAAYIGGVTATGYGEHLIKAAFKADYGEVETVAHYKAADRMLPGVEFILDIGGQDMKCLTVRKGAIHSISLNEACSAGCGSFIETFAKSLQIDVPDFAQMALMAKNPVDLGTRCTVFMNSNVKQAQKEGASVADISAGLSYAVIRNSLYKVIRLRRIDDLPEKIIVQGGTFYNEAVLRAFELLTKRQVVRMDIAGLMGAFGAALIALERHVPGSESSFITLEELAQFSVSKRSEHCKLCPNKCRLLITSFNDGREFVSGNRCERGARVESVKQDLPNLYQYKLQRFFNYKSIPKEQAKRGTVGIPRVLNQYENYPFWHAFFTHLGFSVVLSGPSSNKVYQKGIETIPSESVCFPAKLVHGHIESLLAAKVDRVFFPSIAYELKEFKYSNNNFNCPIVSTYSEVIRTNMDSLKESGIKFHNPFLNLADLKSMRNVLYDEFADLKISKSDIKAALDVAWDELTSARTDIRKKGQETLDMLAKSGQKGIVLAGRPYHVDPGVNHGIDKIIVEEGLAVLTEDSVAHLGSQFIEELRVVDQWSYHSRLYGAAALVANTPNVEVVQLTSFGCGLDALTVDQVDEILQTGGKIYTVIKIDEGGNLGAARIRIRSLKAAMDERDAGLDFANDHIDDLDIEIPMAQTGTAAEVQAKRQERKKEKLDEVRVSAGVMVPVPPKVPYTEEMRGKYTLLAPQMSPIHFRFIEPVLNAEGYNVEILNTVDRDVMDIGLKYVHNDSCYPCVMVIGQLIHALQSGKYDPNRTGLLISQTGGQCRATNYIALLRKALADINCSHVPVVSLNASGMENNPGFSYSFSMLKKAIMAIIYGDLLMRCLYRVRPYEVVKGSANALYEKWDKKLRESLMGKSKISEFSKNVSDIVDEFDNFEINSEVKPKVGVVGEILVKFHPDANNNLIERIEEEGGEAVVPDLLDFFLYCFHGAKYDRKHLGGGFKSFLGFQTAISLIEWMRGSMRKKLTKSKRFGAPMRIDKLAEKASSLISLGNQSGEGWLLTGEMMELIEHGVTNIVCVQPFACLPNHIVGRGMMKPLKERYPHANIAAIDYDPGVSEVNQINRLKLMMSVARNAVKKGQKGNH